MSIGGLFLLETDTRRNKTVRGVVPERFGWLDAGMTYFDNDDFRSVHC